MTIVGIGMRMYGFVDRHFDLDGHKVVADYLVPFIEDELAPILENRLVDEVEPIQE